MKVKTELLLKKDIRCLLKVLSYRKFQLKMAIDSCKKSKNYQQEEINTKNYMELTGIEMKLQLMLK